MLRSYTGMPRILVIALIFLSCAAAAQNTKNVEEVDGVYLLETMVVDGDTNTVVTQQQKLISGYLKSRS